MFTSKCHIHASCTAIAWIPFASHKESKINEVLLLNKRHSHTKYNIHQKFPACDMITKFLTFWPLVTPLTFEQTGWLLQYGSSTSMTSLEVIVPEMLSLQGVFKVFPAGPSSIPQDLWHPQKPMFLLLNIGHPHAMYDTHKRFLACLRYCVNNLALTSGDPTCPLLYMGHVHAKCEISHCYPVWGIMFTSKVSLTHLLDKSIGCWQKLVLLCIRILFTEIWQQIQSMGLPRLKIFWNQFYSSILFWADIWWVGFYSQGSNLWTWKNRERALKTK